MKMTANEIIEKIENYLGDEPSEFESLVDEESHGLGYNPI